MLTFKEYILLEGRVNWNEYGSWINSKTREVLDVENEQHENDMDEYIKKNHPKFLKSLPADIRQNMIKNMILQLNGQ